MSKITKQGDQTVVRPGRDIIASIAQEMRSELQTSIKEVVKEMVIDLREVKMIDSIGLGVLIATYNSLNQDGKKLTVTNASQDIFKLFQSLRLDQYIEVQKAG